MEFLNRIEFKSSIEENNFVGIKYKNNKIHICVPLGHGFESTNPYNLEMSKNIKLKILLLLKSISIAKKLDNVKNRFGENTGDENEVPFNSFLWMINDYLNNGLYQEVEKKYKQRSNGKINWKKTLSSEKFFSDDNIVFINPFYESTYQRNNLITELCNYCIRVSNNYIGFMFGNIKISEGILNNEEINSRKKYYLNIVNKELATSFNDRKKLLLIHIKRIISMSGNDDNQLQSSYGTYKYEYVWETMVNNVFGSKSISICDYFPEAYWSILNKEKEKDKSKLRPDSIYKDSIKEKLYILDAKYYKYGVTANIKDLPHTDSIQKQITYGDHIFTNNVLYDNIISHNIYNAFIIPFNKFNNRININKNICYYGFAESGWKKKNDEKSYERVALILVDTKYLIDCYYKKEIRDIDSLISSIEKVNN